MTHFASLHFFYLLLLIPLYFGGEYLLSKKTKTGFNVSVFEDLRLAQGENKYLFIIIWLKKIVLLFILVLWIFVLARPQGSYEKKEISKKGIDIIVALDVSGSMTAEDLKPNRIEAAKKSLEKFISKLESDRLGLIVFSGKAFTQSPLTFDYNILQEYMENISTESVDSNVPGLSGTAIGDAVLSAVNRFKDSKDRTKVLVLLTDGDANTGVDPKLAVKKASESGIKVYTVGIGKEGGAPILTNDFLGRKTYVHKRDGSLYMATFNEDALKEMAEIGQGKYFRVGDNESFDRVMEEINSLEKREIKTDISTEYTENFMPFLFSLMFLLFVYLFLEFYKPIIK